MIAVMETLLRGSSRFLMVIVGACILLMMVHVTADVTLKLVFNAPLHGTSELVGNYYMIGAVFLTIPLVELENRQIYVDLFFNMMARWMQVAAMVVVYLLQIGFFGALGYESLMDAIESIQKREIVEGYYKIIIWPARCMLPLGFLLAMLVSAVRLVQTVLRHPGAAITAGAPDTDAEAR